MSIRYAQMKRSKVHVRRINFHLLCKATTIRKVVAGPKRILIDFWRDFETYLAYVWTFQKKRRNLLLYTKEEPIWIVLLLKALSQVQAHIQSVKERKSDLHFRRATRAMFEFKHNCQQTIIALHCSKYYTNNWISSNLYY